MTSARGTVFVTTYGCQMNDLDSELVRGHLTRAGFRVAASEAEADIVLLNTCSVRALAEQKVWSQLGRLAAEKHTHRPALVIGVLGCMAEREAAHLAARMPEVDVICGPSNLDRLPELLAKVATQAGRQVSIAGHASRRSSTLEAADDGVETLDRSRAFSPIDSKFQAYVRVTRGCNKLCSFCVVPFVRGPEVHREPDAILDEVKRLCDAGARELTLLGQTVNHYRYSDGGKTTTFAELLWRVHESVPELPRLRFVTSYPRDFGDDILDVMAAAPRINRYLHLPAQSGSSRLLKLMNRGYSIEEYEALVARAREKLPDVRFAGDMIAGFPSETDADHQSSVALLLRVRYKNAFIFKYSPREGTAAARRLADDVAEETKKQRNLELLAAQTEVSAAANCAELGHVLEVLVESEGRLRTDRASRADAFVPLGVNTHRLIGRTRYDEIVAFDGPLALIGQQVRVRAREATSLTILGDLVA